MMDGIYYVILEKRTATHVGPRGVSRAPHLYRTEGIANGIRKQKYSPDCYEVVAVQLTQQLKGA